MTETGGTSGVIIDNLSSSGQASSIYFATQGASTDTFTLSSVTNANSRNGTIATYTTTAAHNFQVGESVTTSGNVNTCNGTPFGILNQKVVTVPSSTTFTVSVSNSGATTCNGGTVDSASTVFHAVKLTQSGLL